MYDIKIINAKIRNSSELVNIGTIKDKIADICLPFLLKSHVREPISKVRHKYPR